MTNEASPRYEPHELQHVGRRDLLLKAGAIAAVAAGTQALLGAEPASAHGAEFVVTAYGTVGDGTTNDRNSIQAAIDACAASGGGTVHFPPGIYLIGSSLHARTAVTLQGTGVGSVILGLTNLSAVTNPDQTTTIENFSIQDLVFRGTVQDAAGYPSRNRTQAGGAGMAQAVNLSGDRMPDEQRPSVRNFAMRRCRIERTSSLPIVLRGISGVVEVVGCSTYLTLDVGFVFCEAVQFIGNNMEKSADNGVSISRGCERVVCANNMARDCEHAGIWICGFLVDGSSTAGDGDAPGPDWFSCTGNVVQNCGGSGIQMTDGPRHGVIAGNLISTVHRGNLDEPYDYDGVGIFIGGYPFDQPAAPSRHAYGISVVGNTLIDCKRGGIAVRGAQHVSIVANTVINPGDLLIDGSVAPPTAMLHNFGVLFDHPTTSRGVTIKDNVFVDERTSPQMNWPIANFTGVVDLVTGDNASTGARQPLEETPTWLRSRSLTPVGAPGGQNLLVTAQSATPVAAGSGAFLGLGGPTSGSLTYRAYGGVRGRKHAATLDSDGGLGFWTHRDTAGMREVAWLNRDGSLEFRTNPRPGDSVQEGGYIILAASPEPPPPPAGKLALFAFDSGGAIQLRVKRPSGTVHTLGLTPP